MSMMDYSAAIPYVLPAALLFAPGFVCMSCSLYTLFIFAMVPSTRSPFSAIVLARSFSHFGDSVLYGVYFPMKILLFNMGVTWKASYLDGMVVAFWMVLSPTEFLLALNRFAAVNLPTKYSIIFTMKNTIMLIISWGLGIAAYFAHMDCWVELDYKNFELAYPSDNCALIDRIGSNYLMFPSLAISLILALTAFGQTIYRSNKNGNLHNRRQWLLFAQAPTQILCWAVSTVFWVSDMRNYSEERLWKVVCIMLPQAVSHCLERYKCALAKVSKFSIAIVLFHLIYKRQRS